MRIVGKGAVIHGPEGHSPPLAWVTVDEDEGNRLIALKVAARVHRDDDAEPQVFVDDGAVPAWALSEAGSLEDFDILERLAVDGAYAPWFAAYLERNAPELPEGAGSEEPEREGADGGEGDALPAEPDPRQVEITDAIDLLEPADFVKSGARAGLPKLDALKGVLGYDVTAEEVDVAFAAKAAA